ncbi:MAG: hypothetical protein ACLVHE_05030 [Dialister invisus]|uniref:hypothetical protein n=1 Tax=Dialister invisus TaxID=218538 RepID=UPI00307DF764
MGFFDRSNESASPIGLLRAHIGTFMYCVKMGKRKFQNKEDIGDIFLDMDQTKFLLDQATRGSLYDFRQRIDSALWDAAVHKYSEDLDKLKKALLKAVDQGAAKAADIAEEEPEEIVPEKEEEKSGDWRDHILDEMKEAEEAAKKNVPSKEERGVKTDDSKEMSEADCRELWKLIKEMDKEFREMKQIADEWLMVNGRKDGCLGAVFAAMLLPAGAIYGIWSLF